MVRQRHDIPLTETWARNDWSHFDTYQATTTGTTLGREPSIDNNFGLSTQRHIDIRTFSSSGTWTTTGGGTIVTGSQSGYNHANGAALTLPNGTSSFANTSNAIDFTTLGPNTLLVLSTPDFPAGTITRASSSIDFSTDNFVTTKSLSISSSLTDPNTAHYLSFAYSSLTGIDFTKVINVRLSFVTTGTITIHVLALRLIDVRWQAINVDFNTRSNRLHQTIPLDANTIGVASGNHTLPSLWRSAEVPGIDDPRPINGEFSVLFNVGSQTKRNTFTLYLREQTLSFSKQIDLQGRTQASLSGLPQPIVGSSNRVPRPMSDLDMLTMDRLDTNSMMNLEATSNPALSSWIAFTINWGTTPLIQITNSADPSGGFQYAVSFTNGTTYAAICNLTEGTAQLQIFAVNSVTLAIGNLLFDSTTIPDAFRFPRRPGRVGFQATLGDGDAYIGAIRPRSLMFAEYRSAPLKSITPVQGAQLYAQNTPPIELFSSWAPLSDGTNQPTLAPDTQRMVGDDQTSTRIAITTPSVGPTVQGVISNVLSQDSITGITDFGQLQISFNVWMPSSAINGGIVSGASILSASLVNSGGLSIPVILPVIHPDQWQLVTLFAPIPQPYPLSDLYQLVIHYNGAIGTTWWLDTVHVRQHVVRWDARAVIDDPWQSNAAPWTPFHENLNSDTNGVCLTTLGTDLQIRGQSLQQNTAILGAPAIVPRYAQLGRLVWAEDAFVSTGSPTASITPSNVGRAYTLTAVASSPNGIANYRWSFGDGTFGSGPVVTHTYPSWYASGTQFTVDLTVYDRAGLLAHAGYLATLV